MASLYEMHYSGGASLGRPLVVSLSIFTSCLGCFLCHWYIEVNQGAHNILLTVTLILPSEKLLEFIQQALSEIAESRLRTT